MGCVVDLDGVVWLAGQPIPGAAEAIALLRAAGEDVVFVTNNAGPTVEHIEAQLDAAGIPGARSVITSASRRRPPRARLAGVGVREGVVQALVARGVHIVEEAPTDAVVVGFHRTFDYDGMTRAATAVRAGARFVATNTDATYPTPDGPIPAAGPSSPRSWPPRAWSRRSPASPTNPSPTSCGRAWVTRASRWVTGLEIDGLFARTLGYQFALVLTGITPEDLPVTPEPEHVAANLLSLVEKLDARPGRSRDAQG